MGAGNNISGDERDFCNLLVFGVEPFGGDPVRCYVEVFQDDSPFVLKNARELMERPGVKEYLEELRTKAQYTPEEIKSRLTNKLLAIMDECSHGTYYDRKGVEQSPAALRAVTVNAAKVLMELYPVKAATESKLTVGADGENGGITFNVIVPEDKPHPEI